MQIFLNENANANSEQQIPTYGTTWGCNKFLLVSPVQIACAMDIYSFSLCMQIYAILLDTLKYILTTAVNTNKRKYIRMSGIKAL